jgi:hypothetical protein
MDIAIVILSILGVLFWLWTLIDALRYEFSGQNKVIWILSIIFLNLLGSILYVIIGRKQRINVPEKPLHKTPNQDIASLHNEDYWQRRIRETAEEREK